MRVQVEIDAVIDGVTIQTVSNATQVHVCIPLTPRQAYRLALQLVNKAREIERLGKSKKPIISPYEGSITKL